MAEPCRVKIGIVGFGKLGQHIARALLSEPASRRSASLRFCRWSPTAPPILQFCAPDLDPTHRPPTAQLNRCVSSCQLVFCWNRSTSVFATDDCSFLPASLPLHNLADFASRYAQRLLVAADWCHRGADLIVEVAHPDITRVWQLQRCDVHADWRWDRSWGLASSSMQTTW